MSPAVHMMKNTDKDYPCTQCGSKNSSVVREDANNPRLKCNNCSFMFNGKDSLAAVAAGEIKPSSPETLAEADEPEIERLSEVQDKMDSWDPSPIPTLETNNAHVPAQPAYVFISKDRRKQQFCSKRDFKKVAVSWSQSGSFDVYKLEKQKLNVKVDLI